MLLLAGELGLATTGLIELELEEEEGIAAVLALASVALVAPVKPSIIIEAE